MMSRRGLQAVWLSVVVGALLPHVLSAEPKAKKDAPAADKKTKGRLPTHFGQLGLSDVQRDRVYEIQGKYEPEIDKLEAQLAEVRARQKTEIQGVLTAEQKAKYEEAVAAAKNKRATKAAKDGDEPVKAPAAAAPTVAPPASSAAPSTTTTPVSPKAVKK